MTRPNGLDYRVNVVSRHRRAVMPYHNL